MGLFDEVITRALVKTFAPRPKFTKVNDTLIVTSTWRTTLLTLGARHKKLIVDPHQRILRIIDRRFWLFRTSRRIEFDWVAQILFDDYDMAGSSWYSYFENDLLLVGLLLKNGEKITLFRFWQQGDFVNNSIWPDWMQWEDFAAASIVPPSKMDTAASQLGYVLSGLIGVPFD